MKAGMTTKRDAAVAQLERPTEVSSDVDATGRARPVFFVPLGRGNTGKTVLLRWAVERAHAEGRFPVIADADRTNQTLAGYFDKVLSPHSNLDIDIKDWLDALIENQIETRATVVLDLGGGDLVLKQHAASMEMVPFLESHEVDVVAAHLIGPNLDDLAYLQSVEANATFAPARTILILNEGLISSGRSEQRAFEQVMAHRVFAEVVERGGRVVRMPRLGCLHEVEARRVSFAAAEAGHSKGGVPPLGLVNRQRVSIWLREMNAAFAPVAEFLP